MFGGTMKRARGRLIGTRGLLAVSSRPGLAMPALAPDRPGAGHLPQARHVRTEAATASDCGAFPDRHQPRRRGLPQPTTVPMESA